jgi:hypothetical protein
LLGVLPYSDVSIFGTLAKPRIQGATETPHLEIEMADPDLTPPPTSLQRPHDSYPNHETGSDIKLARRDEALHTAPPITSSSWRNEMNDSITAASSTNTVSRQSTFNNSSSDNSTQSSIQTSTPPSSDLSTCRYCSGISLESLTKPGGYRHASNRASLVRSAQKCRLCSLLFRKDRTRHTVPLYLSLEQSDGAEADEVGQVCLKVRHGPASHQQDEEEGDGLTFFLYTSAGQYWHLLMFSKC